MRLTLLCLAVLVLGGCHRPAHFPERELSDIERLQEELNAMDAAILKDRRVMEENDENRLPWTSMRAELSTYNHEKMLHQTEHGYYAGTIQGLESRIRSRENALDQRKLAYEEAKARIEANEGSRKLVAAQLVKAEQETARKEREHAQAKDHVEE